MSNKSKHLIYLSITTAAGTAAGMLLNRKKPLQNGIIGAVAGSLAGLAITELYKFATKDADVSFYTKSSSLYDMDNGTDYD